MLKKIALTLVMFVITTGFKAQVVKLESSDGFVLVGDYVKATAKKNQAVKGVLMLHQCNQDRSMYSNLATELSSRGISTMSLDFRGYGDSVKDGVTIKSLRAKATSRKHYFEMASKAGIGKHRAEDVEMAYQYLSQKLGTDAAISVIGTSCGGTQAVLLAQNHKLDNFIFFSVGMNEKTRAMFQKVSDVPALFIAAQGDSNTYKSMHTAFLDANSEQSRFISYKGNAHGRPLFKQDTNLQQLMANWFSGS